MRVAGPNSSHFSTLWPDGENAHDYLRPFYSSVKRQQQEQFNLTHEWHYGHYFFRPTIPQGLGGSLSAIFNIDLDLDPNPMFASIEHMQMNRNIFNIDLDLDPNLMLHRSKHRVRVETKVDVENSRKTTSRCASSIQTLGGPNTHTIGCTNFCETSCRFFHLQIVASRV